MSGWSAEGSRFRGALAILKNLHDDGRCIRERGGMLGITPMTALLPADLNIIRDLKPEILAVLKRHPDPTDWPRLLWADPDWDLRMARDHQTVQQ